MFVLFTLPMKIGHKTEDGSAIFLVNPSYCPQAIEYFRLERTSWTSSSLLPRLFLSIGKIKGIPCGSLALCPWSHVGHSWYAQGFPWQYFACLPRLPKEAVSLIQTVKEKELYFFFFFIWVFLMSFELSKLF